MRNPKRPYYVLRRGLELLHRNYCWLPGGISEDTVESLLIFDSKKQAILTQHSIRHEERWYVRIYNLTQEETQFLSMCKLKGIKLRGLQISRNDN